jgi:ribosome-associated protein
MRRFPIRENAFSTTPVGPTVYSDSMLRVTNAIVIDEADLDERFVRASGPGGQNVNKVASAVELRFDVARSSALDEGTRQRLRQLAGSRLTAEGVLLIDARRYRTQADNRKDARQRLAALIRAAAARPKTRRRTTPTSTSIERRITTKRRRGEKKERRGRVAGED